MTEEEKAQAREYLTWLTESMVKLELGRDVLERRLTNPGELRKLGKTALLRTRYLKAGDAPEAVHAVQELLGGPEDGYEIVTAIAWVYSREFKEPPPELPQGEGNTALWYH